MKEMSHKTIRPRIEVFQKADELRRRLGFNWNAYLEWATKALEAQLIENNNKNKEKVNGEKDL